MSVFLNVNSFVDIADVCLPPMFSIVSTFQTLFNLNTLNSITHTNYIHVHTHRHTHALKVSFSRTAGAHKTHTYTHKSDKINENA